MQSEIRGRYCVDDGISGCTYGAGPDFISRAENLTTRHGVNGAVAELVRVSNGTPFCSGTLVSRYHLLTAGHCVHGKEKGTFRIKFAQSGVKFDEASRMVVDHRGPANGGGGKDVAIITLEQLVPPSIVENIPRVNTRDVSGFLRANRGSDYMIAGYGERAEDVPLDHKRRYGGVGTVRTAILNCSWIGSIMGVTCLRFPELWLLYHGDYAKGMSGDSGGPLFGKDKATGEYVLIGVRSGHRWWKSEANFESNKQVYAPIGKLGKVSYENPDGTRDDGGVQVADIIGGDSDRDGIPDSMDNCKFTYNPYQEDDDGDGLGDACDNCRQTVCDAIGDGRSCRTPTRRTGTTMESATSATFAPKTPVTSIENLLDRSASAVAALDVPISSMKHAPTTSIVLTCGPANASPDDAPGSRIPTETASPMSATLASTFGTLIS